jgi:hypothetical protein
VISDLEFEDTFEHHNTEFIPDAIDKGGIDSLWFHRRELTARLWADWLWADWLWADWLWADWLWADWLWADWLWAGRIRMARVRPERHWAERIRMTWMRPERQWTAWLRTAGFWSEGREGCKGWRGSRWNQPPNRRRCCS